MQPMPAQRQLSTPTTSPFASSRSCVKPSDEQLRLSEQGGGGIEEMPLPPVRSSGRIHTEKGCENPFPRCSTARSPTTTNILN